MYRKLLALILLSLLWGGVARAQSTVDDLVGLGMKPELAEYIAGTIVAGTALTNNTYLKSEDAAGTSTISLIKANATDDTVINSDASDPIIFQQGGDANRLLTYGASSDTALTLKFGDGSTAVQQITISAASADAADDSSLILAGGGAATSNGTRGAIITIPGEEVSGGSDITYNAGAGDTHIFQVAGTTEATISDDALTFAGASASLAFGATSGLIKLNGNTEFTIGDDTLTYSGTNAYLYTTGTALTIFPASDLNRRISFSAANDTNHYIQFGDGGTSPTQDLYVVPGTSDSDDDSTLYACGGGAAAATRGGCISLKGEEVSGGGDIAITSGASDTIALVSGDVTVSGTLDFTGDTAGFVAGAAANQACTTTCGAGKGCILGLDAATHALVACDSALADTCICSAA